MSEYKLTYLYKRGLDYKTRNFLFFLVLLGLTIALFLASSNTLKKKQFRLKQEYTKIKQEYEMLSSQATSSAPLKEKLNELEEELALSDKTIPDKNDPTITLSYIFDIFRKYHNNFHFNFRIQDSGVLEDDKELSYNRYVLSGSAYINLLYVFIDQFERQPSLYTIESLELKSKNPESEGLVDFNIQIIAYYTQTGIPIAELTLKNLKVRRLPYNLFYPRIYDPYANSTEEFYELVDVKTISVVGMTQDKLFIRNDKTGDIEVLYLNDRVQHGILYRIDWENQEAIFRINPTGLTEEIKLKIKSQ
jgi:Tfp pilus assembly protein PilO